MSTKEEVLKTLEENREKNISGEQLATALNVSRSAIWKAINELKKDGYKIKAITNKGYTMSDDNDLISAEGIRHFLKEKNVEILVYKSLDSTNKTAKQLALDGAKNNTVVIANEQSAGRGRLGREFFSPKDSGIYMSIILKPNLTNESATLITTAISVAVCRAIEKIANVEAGIKWVNDIVISKKKVCGILTEATMDFESGSIDSIIAGIGINVSTTNFPEELSKKAGCITTVGVLRNQLIAEIINEVDKIIKNLSEKEFIREYKNRSVVIGKDVEVIPLGRESYFAKVVDIDENGGLVICYNNKKETLISGEISIKGDFYG